MYLIFFEQMDNLLVHLFVGMGSAKITFNTCVVTVFSNVDCVVNQPSLMLNIYLYVQTTLAPNSRTRVTDTGVFKGSNGESDEIYSMPLIVHDSVSKNETFQYSTLPGVDLQLGSNTGHVDEDQQFNKLGTFLASDRNFCGILKKVGQKVEIFLINLDIDIPTALVDTEQIEK